MHDFKIDALFMSLNPINKFLINLKLLHVCMASIYIDDPFVI